MSNFYCHPGRAGGSLAYAREKKPKLTDSERYKRFLDVAERVGASDKQEDLDMIIKRVASNKVRNPSRRTEPDRD
jgi:hypothetical protein